MVDTTSIGLTGHEYQFPLERGKAREFAQAVKAHDPVYFAVDTPLSHPTFLATAGRFWGYTFDTPGDSVFASVDLDRSLLLHAEEEFVFYGPPPCAGMTLLAQTKITDVARKEGRKGGTMLFVVTETSYKNEHGDLIAVSRTTVVKTQDSPNAERRK